MKKFTKLLWSLTSVATVVGATMSSSFAAPPAGVKLAKEQVYNVNAGAPPETLDPSLASDAGSFLFIKSMFDTLVREKNIPGTDRAEYAPEAAESWTISPDGLTWTFKLRKGAKWHDGKPVTAKDFVYSWQRLTDPKTAAPYGDYLVYANVVNADEVVKGKLPPSKLGVRAVDDYTLEVKLKRPTPWFTQMTSLAVLAPLREDVVSKYGKAWTGLGKLIGNGPYKLTKYSINDTIIVEKYPQFWDAKNVTVNKIVYDFISDPSANYIGYLSGRYLTSGVTPQQLAKFKKERPEELVSNSNLSVSWFEFNLKKVPDVRVRKAFNLLIDRKLLNDKVTVLGKPTATFVLPNIEEGGKIRERSWFNNPQSKNNEEAVKLLTAAGYTKDKPFVVNLLSGVKPGESKLLVALTDFIKRGSKGLMELKIEYVEVKTYFDLVRSGKFQLASFGWNADYNHVSTFTDIYRCGSKVQLIGYCNKKYDALLDQALNEKDKNKRAALYAQAVDLFSEEYATVPLAISQSTFLKSPALGGFSPNAQTRYWQDYYIIADKRAKK